MRKGAHCTCRHEAIGGQLRVCIIQAGAAESRGATPGKVSMGTSSVLASLCGSTIMTGVSRPQPPGFGRAPGQQAPLACSKRAHALPERRPAAGGGQTKASRPAGLSTRATYSACRDPAALAFGASQTELRANPAKSVFCAEECLAMVAIFPKTPRVRGPY
jgi:hypothetical protein